MDNLPLLVAAAGAGFVAYKAFAPEPTIDIVRAPIHTDAAKVGELCSRVRSNAERWNAISPAKKLQFLKNMLQCHKQSLATVADKSARVRGWQDTELEGTGFVMGTALTSSYLYGLIEMYEALVAGGMPKETAARQVGDCEVKTVAPRGLWMKVSSPQVVELWSEPGKKLVQKKGAPMGDGGLVGVMNPGNFECPTDVLYQMFVEGNVCVAKTHPGNAESMNETMSVLFGELQKLGFIEITTGGADVGGAILNDANVTSWMMTGGCATFNAITFGGDPKSNKKRLDKECHAELGAASPYLVVPSNDWTDADIQYQATILACFKFVNVGAVCASPQSIIIDRNWSRAQQFVDELQSALRKMPAIKPYYAGSQQRLTALKQNCTSAISFDNGIVFVPDMDGEGGGGDYLLETEVFAPGMGIKYVSSEGDAKRFLQEAAILANDKCFGSLSCTIVVPPTTLKALGRAAVDEAVNRFKWGTVGINLWAGFAAGNPYGTWGAPPGRHSDEDIQSGKGLMGNCLRFENIYRSTIKGEWNDPIMMKLLNPALGKSSKLATAYGTMAARQTVGSLLSTLGAAFF